MHRRRWLIRVVLHALAHRKGRTLLLVCVLTMASSLATALGVVSASMGKRVAQEVRRYGANLVLQPRSSRLEVGSGGLNFGVVSEPAYLERREVESALARSGVAAERSFHLRGSLHGRGADLPVEGVDFAEIRRLFPWWQLKGSWPGAGEAVVGSDLAARLSLKQGDLVELAGSSGTLRLRVSGVVVSGGEEDDLLFLSLAELQQALGLPGQVTQVRLLVSAEGDSVARSAQALQRQLPAAQVSEVRQTARTSEGLVAKVKLLMLLVTGVVVICAGSSVAGTMSTAVLERGKEIGLMKAMGGTRLEVMLIFCGEAVLLGVVGGAAGYLCGSAIAEFVTRSVFAASSDFVPLFAPVSLAVSLFLALLGSLGPMVSVYKLDPVRSLRGE